MTNRKKHQVVNALVKGGHNEWQAISMVNEKFEEATTLYPSVTAPSQIAKLIVLAASL